MEGPCAGWSDVTAYLAEFALGEIVYLRTDEDQSPRMITEAGFTLDGGVVYVLACGAYSSKHYGPEMTRDAKLDCTVH